MTLAYEAFAQHLWQTRVIRVATSRALSTGDMLFDDVDAGNLGYQFLIGRVISLTLLQQPLISSGL